MGRGWHVASTSVSPSSLSRNENFRESGVGNAGEGREEDAPSRSLWDGIKGGKMKDIAEVGGRSNMVKWGSSIVGCVEMAHRTVTGPDLCNPAYNKECTEKVNISYQITNR